MIQCVTDADFVSRDVSLMPLDLPQGRTDTEIYERIKGVCIWKLKIL